jgi:hypothetical protein
MGAQGWTDENIFVDRTRLKAGDAWADMIFAEVEAADASTRTPVDGTTTAQPWLHGALA